jgi:predicted metal-binding protein
LNAPVLRNVISKAALDRLAEAAAQLGASGASIIPSGDILTDNELAKICNGSQPCGSYGLAPSCPPHVSGPKGFRKWQEKSTYSIVVRIDVPSSAMFSGERREIMQLLHEIVSGVEKTASEMGYIGSKAFAGGSCKDLFCHDEMDCLVLSDKGECRYPQLARPSMSGFGINVAKLIKSAGWSGEKVAPEDAMDAESMSWVAGLIVIADVKV